jgi:hypothetical protein
MWVLLLWFLPIRRLCDLCRQVVWQRSQSAMHEVKVQHDRDLKRSIPALVFSSPEAELLTAVEPAEPRQKRVSKLLLRGKRELYFIETDLMQ